jgi:hypothetical protein
MRYHQPSSIYIYHHFKQPRWILKLIQIMADFCQVSIDSPGLPNAAVGAVAVRGLASAVEDSEQMDRVIPPDIFQRFLKRGVNCMGICVVF